MDISENDIKISEILNDEEATEEKPVLCLYEYLFTHAGFMQSIN